MLTNLKLHFKGIIRSINNPFILKVVIPSAILTITLTFILMTRFVFNNVSMNPQVNFMTGECLYQTAESKPWQNVTAGMKFYSDYKFKTGSDSMIDLLLQNNTVVRITANSIMSINTLNANKIEIFILEGSIFGKIKKLFKFQNLAVKSRTSVAAIRGTEFCTEIAPDGGTANYCVGGAVELAAADGNGEKIIIDKNMKASINQGNKFEKAEKMTPDEIAKINKVIESIRINRVKVITSQLLFLQGNAELTQPMKKQLDVIYNDLRNFDGTIQIVGHTDNTGSPDINLKLSLNRAKSISEYLGSKGIAKDKLIAEGKGEKEPVASNSTPEGRDKNRRVEFVVNLK